MDENNPNQLLAQIGIIRCGFVYEIVDSASGFYP